MTTLLSSSAGGCRRNVEGLFFGNLEDLKNGYIATAIIVQLIKKARMSNMVAVYFLCSSYESSPLCTNIEESLHDVLEGGMYD